MATSSSAVKTGPIGGLMRYPDAGIVLVVTSGGEWGPSWGGYILGQDNIIRHIFLKKWAKPGLFLFIFRSFHTTNIAQKTIDDKSVDGVLGTQTQGGRMVGTDKSTELWRHPK